VSISDITRLEMIMAGFGRNWLWLIPRHYCSIFQRVKEWGILQPE
jgi:hypothetical protein